MLCVIVSPDICVGDIRWRVKELCDGGVSEVILRAKWLEKSEFTSLATELKSICKDSGAKLVINHFYDVSLELGLLFWASGEWLEKELKRLGLSRHELLDGKHGLRNLDVKSKFYAPAHSLDEARIAVSLGASSLVVSPVFGASSKPGIKPATTELIKEVASAYPLLNILALGGINHKNAAVCLACGAKGVVVMGEAMRCDNPKAWASKMLSGLISEK